MKSKLFITTYYKSLVNSIVIILVLLAGRNLSAQVGINTSDPKATLDIHASDPDNPTATDGLLIPRVTTLPTPGADQDGLQVYLTAASGDHQPGMHQWDQINNAWMCVTENLRAAEEFGNLTGGALTHVSEVAYAHNLTSNENKAAIAVSNDLLYIANTISRTLSLYSLADPANPVLMDTETIQKHLALQMIRLE